MFIFSYDLVRATSSQEESITERIFDLSDQLCTVRLAPMEAENFNFSEIDHFDLRSDIPGDIYMRIWVAGRSKPVWAKPFQR